MKTKSIKTTLGFAVYRPDGTVQNVFAQSGKVTADQRASLVAWARNADRPDDPHHVVIPKDSDAAKCEGYRVVRVAITPTE